MLHQRFEELKLSGSLPSSSGVGLSVLRLTQNEAASMEELLWCIQADPALTGRIVSLAAMGRKDGEARNASVIEAARHLGMRDVRKAALGFTLVSNHRSGTCGLFDYDRFWSSSLCTAVAARHFSGCFPGVDPEGAFTLGVLSRIGMLALATVHPETYARILTETAPRADHGLCHAESTAFGIDHRGATAAMLAEWGMPDAYSASILALASHGDESVERGAEVDVLLSVIDLAQKVSCVLAYPKTSRPSDRDRAWTQLVERAHRRGIDRDAVVQACGVVAHQWREWCDFIRLPPRDAHGFTEVSGHAPTFTPITEFLEEPRGTSVGVSAAAARCGAPARVLVVDDDERLARLVAHHLTKAGYMVTTATNGNEALRLTLTEHPQIVISDWMMPGMNGLELCSALRQTEDGRSTYILILTAREDEDRIVDAFQAGADDYVTKPFNPRILLARVQAAQRLVDLQRKAEEDKRTREQQVAELGLLTRRLRAAALTDVLTGLPNRRFALSRLKEEWDIAVALNRPLSVLMVDIDNFKAINDNHGHAVGDHVLKATAARLREFTRRGDVVCRLGGEEFLVINVNSDASGAAMCAERLRAAVEGNHIDHETYHGSVTVSLGVAVRTESMRGIDALLKGSDMAIYLAKAAGRNCFRVYEPEEGAKRSA